MYIMEKYACFSEFFCTSINLFFSFRPRKKGTRKWQWESLLLHYLLPSSFVILCAYAQPSVNELAVPVSQQYSTQCIASWWDMSFYCQSPQKNTGAQKNELDCPEHTNKKKTNQIIYSDNKHARLYIKLWKGKNDECSELVWSTRNS